MLTMMQQFLVRLAIIDHLHKIISNLYPKTQDAMIINNLLNFFKPLFLFDVMFIPNK